MSCVFSDCLTKRHLNETFLAPLTPLALFLLICSAYLPHNLFFTFPTVTVHVEEARVALLLPSYAGVQGEGLVFGRGPHQLHNRPSVFHTPTTRERRHSLQTDPDQ